MSAADTNTSGRLTPELESTLRRYVLGDLEEAFRSELEERLVIEPDVFEALGVVEDELIEAYVDGTASAAERAAFERSLLGSARSEGRLRFARALRRRAAASGVSPRPVVARLGPPAWIGLAAALALSLLGNVLLVARRPVPEPDAPREPARVSAPVVSSPSHEEELRAALEREQADRARAEARVAELQLEARRSQGAVPTFALVAGGLRAGGAGAMQWVRPPEGGVAVRLRLELPGDDYPRYRATLVDEDGEELWSASRLASDREGEASVLKLILPASLLSRGDYQVTVRGETETHVLETVGTYPFRVAAR